MAPTKPATGCFRKALPPGSLVSWLIAITAMAPEDCDCHRTNKCPHGEPSRPPLDEFINATVAKNARLAKCPRLPPLSKPLQRDSWLEASPVKESSGFGLGDHHGVAVTNKFESIFQFDGDHFMKRHLDYSVSHPFSLNSLNWTLTLQRLLVDPINSYMIIDLLPPEYATGLLRCGDRAVNKTVGHIRHSAPGVFDPHHGQKLAALANAWLTHSSSRVLDSRHSKYPDADFSICDQVYESAVAALEKQGPYLDHQPVANLAQMGRALDSSVSLAWQTPVLVAMQDPLALARTIAWNETILSALLGSSLPAVTVGMGFLSFSLYTGIV